MRTAAAIALNAVAAVLACAAGAAVASGDGTGLPAPAASAVSVTAREFSLTLSRTSVAAGRIQLQLVNRGEDDHDLLITRRSDARSWTLDVARPGEASTRALRARPGRYRLICTLEGHEALGMAASLRVTQRPSRPPS